MGGGCHVVAGDNYATTTGCLDDYSAGYVSAVGGGGDVRQLRHFRHHQRLAGNASTATRPPQRRQPQQRPSLPLRRQRRPVPSSSSDAWSVRVRVALGPFLTVDASAISVSDCYAGGVTVTVVDDSSSSSGHYFEIVLLRLNTTGEVVIHAGVVTTADLPPGHTLLVEASTEYFSLDADEFPEARRYVLDNVTVEVEGFKPEIHMFLVNTSLSRPEALPNALPVAIGETVWLDVNVSLLSGASPNDVTVSLPQHVRLLAVAYELVGDVVPVQHGTRPRLDHGRLRRRRLWHHRGRHRARLRCHDRRQHLHHGRAAGPATA